ncbi:MAG TPA: NAD(P)-dependent oxidoreductase [Polyangiales bacterium]|nr:NAD(P)-dependent oxidoreductase [Polyangiales bacterium]
MKILVTGADGFLGGHLVRGLEQQHDVTGAVFTRPARAREVRVDLTRDDQLARLPRDVEVVVHAAGMVDGHANYRAMFAANVTSTDRLTHWAHAHCVRHFVHISSVAVYGPLALGEARGEDAPRLGYALGLPYMRTKARAERVVEQSGVPYTLVRPPAVVGLGDTVISRGFFDALRAGGLPMVPGASLERRVSLVTADGLVDVVRLLCERGPLQRALHAVDVELRLAELAEVYARALGLPLRCVPASWRSAVHARNEVGLAWLIASSRFGQHYLRDRLVSELGYQPTVHLDSAVEQGLSSLQGGGRGLF